MVTASQQTANSTRTLQRPTQITSAGVCDRGQVVPIPFLNHEHAVVDVAHLGSLRPGATLPGEFLPNPPTHSTIVNQLALPTVRQGYANQLVLFVVIEAPGPVTRQIAVGVVSEGDRRWEIEDDRIGVRAAVSVLRNRRERVVAVE